MRTLLITTLVGATLVLSACANHEGYTGYTGKNRETVGNCVRERSVGSNIKRSRCGPARDDQDRLRTMGTFDSIAGHARTSGTGSGGN
ncbi:MAG: hypothetical protein AAF417_06525 [Pseudomonadota bacterium]